MNKRDHIVYDSTFEQGKPYGAITCPKCDAKVLYGQHGKTRPKYCPTCEKDEMIKFFGSEYRDCLDDEQAQTYIASELRMPMPSIRLKSVQELISNG